jgi:hypothetical protein
MPPGPSHGGAQTSLAGTRRTFHQCFDVPDAKVIDVESITNLTAALSHRGKLLARSAAREMHVEATQVAVLERFATRGSERWRTFRHFAPLG